MPQHPGSNPESKMKIRVRSKCESHIQKLDSNDPNENMRKISHRYYHLQWSESTNLKYVAVHYMSTYENETVTPCPTLKNKGHFNRNKF